MAYEFNFEFSLSHKSMQELVKEIKRYEKELDKAKYMDIKNPRKLYRDFRGFLISISIPFCQAIIYSSNFQ
jgi:uncharacterized protein Yka (UPF0111/DUF47 family)